MKLRPDMPIAQRIAIIEEALALALDLGPEVSVGPSDDPGALYVWVPSPPYSEDFRPGYSLYQIARELERLLS